MTSVLWSTRGTLAKGSISTLAVSTSRFKFASFCDSFEFPVLSCSFALWTFLTWRNMFLFAPKLFSQWVHLTFSWFFRCVTSKLLFMNDFGLFLQFPAMHIHIPSLGLWILLMWSAKYSLLFVENWHSSQKNILSFIVCSWERSCAINLDLVCKDLLQVPQSHCFPDDLSPWTVRLWRINEAAARLTWQISHWKTWVIWMCGIVVFDAMAVEVQLLNWIMKIKLVNISLSPIVEVCKKKHSFKKQNFKENCQFDKCHIVTFLKVKARGSVNPRSLLVSKMCEL